MRSKVTLDKAGRVVLPKGLRDDLNLSPGDTLDVAVDAGVVTLRPRRTASALRKERGVWVASTGEAVTAQETNETLRRVRADRGRPDAPDRP